MLPNKGEAKPYARKHKTTIITWMKVFFKGSASVSLFDRNAENLAEIALFFGRDYFIEDRILFVPRWRVPYPFAQPGSAFLP